MLGVQDAKRKEPPLAALIVSQFFLLLFLGGIKQINPLVVCAELLTITVKLRTNISFLAK